MSNNNVAIATAYYTAMANKNIAEAEKYLHPDVRFTSPFATVEGKEAVTSAVKEFIAYFKALTIKAVCGSETKAMVAYDVEFPAQIGLIRTAVLLTLCDGLILDYEIFFDASPMRK